MSNDKDREPAGDQGDQEVADLVRIGARGQEVLTKCKRALASRSASPGEENPESLELAALIER